MNKIINQDPYGGLICRWFQEKFSKDIKIDKEDLLEILSDLIFSTKENRVGPIPKPEHQVVVRDVIRQAIALNAPIPILVPWGGRKAYVGDSQRLDMAEVSGIYQLVNLDEAVKKYFSPGLHINIGIEDTGANWLYRQESNISQITEAYSSDFVKMVNMLKGTTRINPMRESSLMCERDYFTLSQEYSELLQVVIAKQMAFPDISVDSISEYKDLVHRGWKGEIGAEQRAYYLSRYESLNPGKDQQTYVRMLADYFGGAKARYELDAKAAPLTKVGKYIQLSFTPPIPGAPAAMTSKAVYWRTVPESQCRTHIAPWRAKGYLKIDGSSIKSKITSFNDVIVPTLNRSITTIEGENGSIQIDCDYIVG